VPWWAAVLVVVGLYLVVGHAWPAWRAEQGLVLVHQQLADVANCPDSGRIGVECGETTRLLNVEASADLLQAYAVGSQTFHEELLRAEFGAAALLLGAVVVAQHVIARRIGKGSASPGSRFAGLPDGSPGIFRGPWSLVESVFAAVVLVLSVGWGFTLFARILSGAPPSLDLLDQSLNQILDVAAAFVQGLR
jgi:hypothetical protein